jgi:hypothetical protein
MADELKKILDKQNAQKTAIPIVEKVVKTISTSSSSSQVIQHSNVSTEKKYYKEFLFAEETPSEIRSIRDPTEILDPELLVPIYEQESFVYWLQLNAVESRTNPSWGSKVPHQKILIAWGMRGMGKLTQTTIIAHRNKINLFYCSLYTLKSGMWCTIFKRAVEMQPAIVFIDNFANLFSREYSHYLTEFCAIFREYLNNPKTQVWVIGCPVVDAIAYVDDFTFLTDLVNEYGTITFVPTLKSSDYQVRKNIATEMVRSIFDISIFPRPTDPQKNEWYITLGNLGTFSQYSTLKEMKDFIVKVYQNAYAQWFSIFIEKIEETEGTRCDFSLEKMVPGIFRTMFSTLPLIKEENSEDNNLRTISFRRRAFNDFYHHTALWQKHSPKFWSSPFNSLHPFKTKNCIHYLNGKEMKVSEVPLTKSLRLVSAIPPTTPEYFPTTMEEYDHRSILPTTPPRATHAPYSPTSPAHNDDYDDSTLNLSEYNPSGYFMSSPSRQQHHDNHDRYHTSSSSSSSSSTSRNSKRTSYPTRDESQSRSHSSQNSKRSRSLNTTKK